jgi:hypothetical protein
VPLGWMLLIGYTWGLWPVFLSCPHSHPPRMTDFISHAQESRFKFPILQSAFVELERVESSFRTSCLRCGLLHSLQKKWSVHMHADKT